MEVSFLFLYRIRHESLNISTNLVGFYSAMINSEM